MPRSIKLLKEDFVSNLPGGSIAEINYVLLVATSATILSSVLQARLSLFTPRSLDAFVLDFLLNCGAIVLAITLYSSAPVLLNALLLSAAALTYLLVPPPKAPRKRRGPGYQQQQHHAKKAEAPQEQQPLPSSTSSASSLSLMRTRRRPFVSAYRGCMLILTCAAILAVDFRVFPRRFAKVETWGTSLMDLGVGAFVFSAGVVAVRREGGGLEPRQARPLDGYSQPMWSRLLASGYRALPLTLMGVVRVLSVKRLDYAEHVSEWGVHWNVFFTLALLAPFSVAFDHLHDALVPSYGLLALMVGALYTLCLELTGLKWYVISAPRVDFLSMNREGIVSFAGYLAIFLAGQSAGAGIFSPPSSFSSSSSSSSHSAAGQQQQQQRRRRWQLGDQGKQRSKPIDALTRFTRRATAAAAGSDPVLAHLAVSTLTWTALFYFVTSSVPFSALKLGLGMVPSRRLANLPYILWVAAVNTGQLLLLYVIESAAASLLRLRPYPSPSRDSEPPSLFGGSSSSSRNDEKKKKEEEEEEQTAALARNARANAPLAVSPLVDAFNRNGLLVFVAANLLTGLVNLTVDTLNASTAQAMLVLLAYMLSLSAVALHADKYKFLRRGSS